MLKLYDMKCQKCRHIWTTWAKDSKEAPCCPQCNSAWTLTLPGGIKHRDKAKDPYDYI